MNDNNEFEGGEAAQWKMASQATSDKLVEANDTISDLKDRIKKLEVGLEGIRDFKPREVTMDEFAYRRLVKAYRYAATKALED